MVDRAFCGFSSVRTVSVTLASSVRPFVNGDHGSSSMSSKGSADKTNSIRGGLDELRPI